MLDKGLYEQVINEYIKKLLDDETNRSDIYTDEIDKNDSDAILSGYIEGIIKKGLAYYKKSENRSEIQVDIANKLLERFSQLIEDEEFNSYRIDSAKENLLLGVLEKRPVPKKLSEVVPITSISKTTLFTGSKDEPTVYSEINKEIESSDRVDLLVSFIKYSGLRLILDALKEHTKTKPLRIITTSYMGATDYKAVEELSKLPNTEIKISYDTDRTRLHAKAYYFHRNTGFSTAYIGSSNMSKAALTEGTEWNLKISEHTSFDVIEKYRITFETYWNSPDFTYFDKDEPYDLVRLKKSLDSQGPASQGSIFFDVTPYAYQQEILDKLEVERNVFGSRKNLIVAATGTGKTVVSAFDFKRYFKQRPGAKLLFLAHRKEILQQSIDAFRKVLKDQNFGDLWVGEHSPSEYDHIFASIQTLNSSSKYQNFKEDHFDYIVLDETHHSAASSYDRLLGYFKPDILLGLTATPERMDNEDILKYFNDRIAYEIRLHDAINRNLLCPFHYFGVTDNVDLDDISWERGGYEISALSNVYTGNSARAELVVRTVQSYTADMNEVKAVGFCVSKEHARYMSDYFNKYGLAAINLDSDSALEKRNTAKARLQKGEIKFIFVVDLYNEGVDIPQINTVLFLRPTESATVFIQQLGRGLRKTEDKDVLTVLDFIGQAHKQYNYRTKLIALIGKSNNTVEQHIYSGFPLLAKGCSVQLEKVASRYILDNLKTTIVNKNYLKRIIRNYRFETEKPLTLGNFLTHYQLELWQIYKSNTFYELLADENLIVDNALADEGVLKSSFKRLLHIDSIYFIDFLLEYLKRPDYSMEGIDEEQKLMLIMFHYTVWKAAPGDDIAKHLYRLKDENKAIFKEIIELLEYKRQHIDFIEKELILEYPCPLRLYSSYTQDQILSALGEHRAEKEKSFREGVLYIAEKNTDIFFITLNKSEKHFKPSTQYEDYAISDRLFHWQSQGRTSDTSPTGQRYISQRKNKNTMLLFVREHNTENSITMPYYFIGKANYISHTGSKPISIVWEMESPMPVAIFQKANKAADII